MAWNGRRRRAQGVTLVEIIVAAVVLTILVAIAIPAHRAYVIRVNRSDAHRDLLALAGQLQRCFERTGDYRLEAAGVSNPCVQLPLLNAEGTYTVSFAPDGIAADRFRLVATPQGAQAADTRCGGLTLDERGTRGITGSSRSPADCWGSAD